MQLEKKTFSEFPNQGESSWRKKAQSEIKDKKLEDVLTRIVGKEISIQAYADSYVCSDEEFALIQKAQKNKLHWKLESRADIETSRKLKPVICSINQNDLVVEISELVIQAQKSFENNEFILEVNLTTDYLLTIAKLRAIRFIISKVLEATNSAANVLLRGFTDASFYKTDNEHINIVRATTMAMSGIVGGCDLLFIEPFDRTHAAFSSRIAKNISLILAEEAYLNEVNDPAAGSYFIENLTYDLVTKSWERVIEQTN